MADSPPPSAVPTAAESALIIAEIAKPIVLLFSREMRRPNQRWRPFASGILIRFNGSHYLVTAAHVLHDTITTAQAALGFYIDAENMRMITPLIPNSWRTTDIAK